MEFRFNVNEVFKTPIVEITHNLIPPGYTGDRRALWDTVSKVGEIVNQMGSASAAAQGLTKPITTADRMRNSEHKLYFLVDQKANNGKGAITGMLKTGNKSLYVFDRDGNHYQVQPPCLLDFYVHESRQRNGLGKQLFEHMLQQERIEPIQMAIDRPSDKLLGFLNKHYSLKDPVKQMNNYVVFDNFFPRRSLPPPSTQTQLEGVRSKNLHNPNSANGLQQFQSPMGRYGAPRPPCSMGQIIHNQSPNEQRQDTTGIQSMPATNYQGYQQLYSPENTTYVTQSTPNMYYGTHQPQMGQNNFNQYQGQMPASYQNMPGQNWQQDPNMNVQSYGATSQIIQGANSSYPLQNQNFQNTAQNMTYQNTGQYAGTDQNNPMEQTTTYLESYQPRSILHSDKPVNAAYAGNVQPSQNNGGYQYQQSIDPNAANTAAQQRADNVAAAQQAAYMIAQQQAAIQEASNTATAEQLSNMSAQQQMANMAAQQQETTGMVGQSAADMAAQQQATNILNQQAAAIDAQRQVTSMIAEQQALISAQQQAAAVASQNQPVNMTAVQQAANMAAQQQAANIATQQQAANMAAQQQAANMVAQQQAANTAAQQEAVNIAAQQQAANMAAQQQAANIAAQQQAANIVAQQQAANIAAQQQASNLATQQQAAARQISNMVDQRHLAQHYNQGINQTEQMIPQPQVNPPLHPQYTTLMASVGPQAAYQPIQGVQSAPIHPSMPMGHYGVNTQSVPSFIPNTTQAAVPTPIISQNIPQVTGLIHNNGMAAGDQAQRVMSATGGVQYVTTSASKQEVPSNLPYQTPQISNLNPSEKTQAVLNPNILASQYPAVQAGDFVQSNNFTYNQGQINMQDNQINEKGDVPEVCGADRFKVIDSIRKKNDGRDYIKQIASQ